MRPWVVAFAGLFLFLVIPPAEAAIHEFVFDGPGWTILTVSGAAGSAGVTAYGSPDGPSFYGVHIYDEQWRHLRSVAGSTMNVLGHSAALSAAPIGVSREVNNNFGSEDSFGGAGTGVPIGVDRFHAIAWTSANRPDIQRKVTLSSQTGVIEHMVSGSGAVWYGAADADAGVAAEAQVGPAQAGAAAAFEKRFTVESRFVGVAVFAPLPTNMVSITGSDGTRHCPCEFTNVTGPNAMAPGDHVLRWTGAGAGFMTPVLVGAKVPIP